MAPHSFLLFIIIKIIYLGCQVDSATHWGPWKTNMKDCQRQCADPHGMMEFYRDCFLCEDSCHVVNITKCQGEAVQVSSCYVGNECTGDGIYTGQMSIWIPLSLCPNPKLPCTGKMRILKRTCQRTEKSDSGEVRCPGDKFTERREPCICGVVDPEAIAVFDPHWGWLPKYGIWSEWSEWNCEQPCVNVTRRTRQCIKNPLHLFDCPMDAEGRLNEDVIPCLINKKSLCKKQNRMCPGVSCLKDWSLWTEWSGCLDGCEDGQMRRRERKCLSTHIPCFGESEELQPCSKNKTSCKTGPHRYARAATPIDGGWTDWGGNICPKICGDGEYFRRRLCINPWPEHYGQKCDNYLNSKISWGSCSVNYCANLQNTLTNAIEATLEMTMLNYFASKDGDATLFCGGELLYSILAVYMDAKVQWTHNGNTLSLDPNRMIIVDNKDSQIYQLILTNLNYMDAGTYSCSIRGGNIFANLNIMTLNVVNPLPILIHDTGGRVEMSCKDIPMNDIIGNNLQYIWKHNDTLVGDLKPISSVIGSTQHIIVSLTVDDTGLWECFVVQQSSNRIWKTTSFQLSIPRPAQTDDDELLLDIQDLNTALDAELRMQYLKKDKTMMTMTWVFGFIGLIGILLIILISFVSYKQYKGYVQKNNSFATLPPNEPSNTSEINVWVNKLEQKKSSNFSMNSLWFKKPNKK